MLNGHSGALEGIGQSVSWLRVVITAGTALLVVGFGGGVWLLGLATKGDVFAAVAKHEALPAHETARLQLQALELNLNHLKATTDDIKRGQVEMDRKIDRLLDGRRDRGAR